MFIIEIWENHSAAITGKNVFGLWTNVYDFLFVLTLECIPELRPFFYYVYIEDYKMCLEYCVLCWA